MQAASHTYGSFSKVIFPDNNSDATELLAPVALNFFRFVNFSYFEDLRDKKNLLYGFLQEKRKSFENTETRDENSFKVTRTVCHLQRFGVTNHLQLNTYTSKTSQWLYLWQSELGRNVSSNDAVKLLRI